MIKQQVLALVIRHPKCIRRGVLSSAAFLDLPYFSALSHKRQDFQRKKIVEHKMCVSIFYTNLSETFLIRRRIQQDTTITVHWVYREINFYSCQTLTKLQFSRQNFFRNSSNIKLRENPSMGADLFHIDIKADGQT